MMDPFEARLQFTQLLSRVSATTPLDDKVIIFAMKHGELEEDLFSCILEVLDKSTINARLNILYFIDSLIKVIKQHTIAKQITISNIIDPISGAVKNSETEISETKKENVPYLINLIVNLPTIYSKVIPPGQHSLVNLTNSTNVLKNIEKSLGVSCDGMIKYTSITNGKGDDYQNGNNYNTDFKRRKLNTSNIDVETDHETKDDATKDYVDRGKIDTKITADINGLKLSGLKGISGAWQVLIDLKLRALKKPSPSKTTEPVMVLAKEQILHRMEEDRERNKILNQSIWTTTRSGSEGLAREFDRSWKQFGDLSTADYIQFKELSDIAELSYKV